MKNWNGTQMWMCEWCVWIYVCGILLMRVSCCEITWGQDNESTSCVTWCSTLLYELVMITKLEQECEFISISIWCNVNLWGWKYNLWACVLRICFIGMLIYVILRGLCIVNEWNTIINMQNDMVKNPEPDDSNRKKKFHQF
jgi:hypothetical protein